MTTAKLETKLVFVGWAATRIFTDPKEQLTIRSLFSCLGVAVIDPVKKVGGLLHTMLPDSSMDLKMAEQNPCLFVDTGIDYLIESLLQIGATKHALHVYLAGGADIPLANPTLNIGARNCTAADLAVKKLGVSVKGKALGGSVPRSFSLRLDMGGMVETAEGKEVIL
jgi:chemotaxis protein CheD